MKSLFTNFLLAYGQEAFPEEREHFSFVKERARLQTFSRVYEDELEQIKSTYRLPRNDDGEPAHLPRRYEVELTMGGLHEEDKNEDGFFEFSADTKIEFTYNTDSDFLVLNAGGIRGYEIVSTDLECDGSPIEHQFEHYTEKEMLIINNKDAKKGADCTLRVINNSYLAKSNTGLYESSYLENGNSGKRHYMATTQYESTGARKTFVCFDDPGLKSTFKFTINYKYPEYTALFNTFVESSSNVGDDFTNVYDETMLMPTYLLAMVISDYQVETVKDRSPDTNTLVRVPAPDYIINDKLGDYSLEAAMRIIDGFSEYFGFDYTQSFPDGRAKTDQIGIPDFAAGAMENWGLVTYQYYLIYVNQVDYYESSIASVAEVIAHELMHQWTGNLITCSWWDEIWINEAFADIGGYLGLRYAEPTWNWESEMNTYEMYTALRADATTNSRPIINKQNNDGFVVESPGQISAQFDNIAYAKGGTVHRMVISNIEETRWQSGMQAYLNENAYTNTDGEIYFAYMQDSLDRNQEQNDLWEVPANFNQTYDCWYRQMGYPLIRINEDNGVLKLSQERFLHRGDESDLALPESTLGYKWNVPIQYVNQAGEYRQQWLDTESESLDITGYAGSDIWIDPESTTFARYHYGRFEQYSEVVSNMIKRGSSGLPGNYFLSIGKMIADQWEILTAEIDYETDIWHLLETTRLVAQPEFAHNSAAWPVWYQMNYIWRSRSTASVQQTVTTAASMNKLMLFSPDRQVYTNYMGNLAGDEIYNYLPEINNVYGNDHEAKMMAKYIIDWHCQMENENCHNLAKANFDRVYSGEINWSDININIRKQSLIYALRVADESDYAKVEEDIFGNESSSYFRNGVEALGYIKSTDYAIEFLEKVRNGRADQFVNAVKQFSGQYLLRDAVIAYFTDNYETIFNSYKDDVASMLDSMCAYMFTNSDEALLADLNGAANSASDGDLPAGISLAFEKCNGRIETNKRWHEDVGAKIVLWLRYFGKNKA